MRYDQITLATKDDGKKSICLEFRKSGGLPVWCQTPAVDRCLVGGNIPCGWIIELAQ